MRLRKRIGVLFLAFIMVFTVMNTGQTAAVQAASGGEFQIRYLSIKGDSTFMRLKTPAGKTVSILVDGGEDANELYNQLKGSAIYNKLANADSKKNPQGDPMKVIDYVFVTHAHRDHFKGLDKVLSSKYFAVRNFYYNKVIGTDNNDKERLNELKKIVSANWSQLVTVYEVGTKSQSIIKKKSASDAGESIALSKGMRTVKIDEDRFTVTLFPAMYQTANTNNASMMLKFKLASQNTSFVFAGDIGKGIIPEVVDESKNTDWVNALKSKSNELTYLKMPHHASRRYTPETGTYTGYLNISASTFGTYGCDTTTQVANLFAVDKTVKAFGTVDINTYSLYKSPKRSTAGSPVLTGIANRDEQFTALFRAGSASKVFGIGNMKPQNSDNVNLADTMSLFPMVGLYAYVDVQPKGRAQKIFEYLDKASTDSKTKDLIKLHQEGKVPELRQYGQTYVRNLTY